MIGLLDTLTLARTKLRSKRILLGITIVVSGLLFGILSAVVIVATGVSHSTEHFFTTAVNGRYLVQAQPNIPIEVYGYETTYGAPPSKELVKQLTTLQETYIAKQKAVYDKHKLTFDKTTIEPILKADPFDTKDSAGNAVQVINRNSPVYQQYLTQRKLDYVKTATNKLSDLKKLAAPYGATNYYHNLDVSLQPNATYLKDGQEKLDDKSNSSSPSSYQDYLTSNIKTSTYVFTDQTLIQRFIFPQNNLRKQNTNAVPVVLTTQEIVKMFGKELGISDQPSDAGAQVKWVKNLQEKSNGHAYAVCYRSPGETALIQKTMQQNTEIAEKKNDKNYVAPTLQYNLPTTPCGELTIKKDVRTPQEKQAAVVNETLQKDLGTYQPLEHQLLKFQIVGSFTIVDPSAQPQNAADYISYLLGPQYMQGAFIPQQMYNALPAESQHKDLLQKPVAANQDVQIFEDAGITDAIISFPTLSAARDFIKQGCNVMNTDCKKSFILGTYGSSYLAIDDISTYVTKIAPIVLLVAMGVATVIIWVTMARVIIDSRRETAVFRALGAKRRDIASIYFLYSLLVALLIVIFMLILGFVIAVIIESLYGAQATNLAKVAYGVFDGLGPFQLIGINLPILSALTGCVFMISLLAVLPPLWRNVRRSPIRDMREE